MEQTWFVLIPIMHLAVEVLRHFNCVVFRLDVPFILLFFLFLTLLRRVLHLGEEDISEASS